MKLLKIFALLLVFQTILFSQSGWVQQNTGTNIGLKVICMINENTGFVGGYNNLLLKTTNGGINWTQNSICSLNSAVNSISFLNENSGMVASGNLSPNSIGMFSNTTNSGISWDCQNGWNPFIHLFLFDNNIGYGTYAQWIWPGLLAPVLKKTTNSGQSWSTIAPTYALDLYFLNVNTGYFINENRLFYKTTNAGNNWNSYQISSINEQYFSTFFVNDITGYTIPNHSQHFYVMKTTNGGMNWVQVNTGLSFPLLSLYFVNGLTGYSTSYNSRIFKTTNGGLNWILKNYMNNSLDLLEIFMVNVNTGYAVGDGGLILKTTNGGELVSTNSVSTEIPNDFSLSQNYPNPFNPGTKIRFDIPQAIGRGDRSVKMTVYDLLGREVSVLVNEELNPGTYEVDFDASNLPSGVYYYKLTTGSYTQTKKMVLLK